MLASLAHLESPQALHIYVKLNPFWLIRPTSSFSHKSVSLGSSSWPVAPKASNADELLPQLPFGPHEICSFCSLQLFLAYAAFSDRGLNTHPTVHRACYAFPQGHMGPPEFRTAKRSRFCFSPICILEKKRL